MHKTPATDSCNKLPQSTSRANIFLKIAIYYSFSLAGRSQAAIFSHPSSAASSMTG